MYFYIIYINIYNTYKFIYIYIHIHTLYTLYVYIHYIHIERIVCDYIFMFIS